MSLGRKAGLYLGTAARLAWIFTGGLLRAGNRWRIGRIHGFLTEPDRGMGLRDVAGAEAIREWAGPRWKAFLEEPAGGPAVAAGPTPRVKGWMRGDLAAAVRGAREEGPPSLDALARRHGTDKSSEAHGYSWCYEHELGHLRGRPVSLLEIGVLKGASLRAWREYFPRGRVHGIDIDEGCRAIPGVFVGSQADPEFLDRVAAEAGPFDVVVDDGSHDAAHQLASFLSLWPRVAPGGCYVVEDLHQSYWSEEGLDRGFMPLLFDLVDACMKHGKLESADPGSPRNSPERLAALSRADAEIEAIHFHPSIAFLWKAGEPRG